MADITQEELKSILDYDEESGAFTWLISTNNRIKVGSVAGSVSIYNNGKKYRRFRFSGKNYLVHRLAWLYMTGEWPKHQIDHEDGNGLNNKWSNLSDVTGSDNSHNQRLRRTNKSGVMGVCWYKRSSKWYAYISIGCKRVHLGCFIDWFDAVCARKSSEYKYSYHDNHGTIRGL